MTIYCVRHGKTNMNEQKIYNGLIDEDINETGIIQAEELKNEMINIDYDKIYCSPLIRAKHTCEIINVKKCPVIFDNRLMERSLGKLDGKDFIAEGLSNKDFFSYYYKSSDPKFEDYPTLLNRVHSFLDEIIKNESNNNILIVSHGAILRAIHFYFNDFPENGDLSSGYKSAPNCKLIKYEI